MKILKSWLKDYVDINLGNEELAEKLTMTGTAVDSIIGTLDEKIIVALIIEINKHPNADKLRLVKVDTGFEVLEIVCGADNIEVGQKVPLAMVGARINGIEIKKANIRGIESNGMLASEQELGLGEDHSGIYVLGGEETVGQPLAGYIKNDAVFDIEVTPNRGDELCHYGVAREVAAVTGSDLRPKKEIKGAIPDNDNSGLGVIIEDAKDCLQYHALKIAGVQIGESPEWLKQRLVKCGLRPINNVVDATNYIMLDLGQPLHAFDAAKIAGQEIIVRLAGEGEKIKTLDNIERNPDTSMLLITDKEKPLAIAGVMGGVGSEVTSGTKDIVLEAAEFDRRSIRRTAKVLSAGTDASYRFERGIDSDSVKLALEKAAEMILEIAGGSIASGIVSAGRHEEPTSIKIEYDKINSLLGLDLSYDQIDSILKSLGFNIVQEKQEPSGNGSRFGVSNNVSSSLVPAWRHDVSIWQDLAEEVGRIYGFSRIPQNEVSKTAVPKKSDYYKKEYIKDLLVNDGFSEVYTYPFLSEADLAGIFGNDGSDRRRGTIPDLAADLLEVANPINIENKYMRKSLLPGLLMAAAKNPSFDPVAIFEIGNVFTKETEITYLGLAVSGKKAKKIIGSAVSSLSELAPSLTDKLIVKELMRNELAGYKIRKPIAYILEIEVNEIIQSMNISESELNLKVKETKSPYRPISKYPSITRDVAFIVDEKTDVAEICHTMYEVSGLINRIELFDEFVSEKFGAGKKNIAYHLDLQHLERTLTDKEADEIVGRVVNVLKTKFGVIPRE